MNMDDIAYIREKVSQEEMLAQLAEEAAELAQAALKMRRTMGNTNPTPVERDAARAALMEEIADVELCMWALELDTKTTDLEQIGKIMRRKLYRWASRLRETEGKEDGRN